MKTFVKILLLITLLSMMPLQVFGQISNSVWTFLSSPYITNMSQTKFIKTNQIVNGVTSYVGIFYNAGNIDVTNSNFQTFWITLFSRSILKPVTFKTKAKIITMLNISRVGLYTPYQDSTNASSSGYPKEFDLGNYDWQEVVTNTLDWDKIKRVNMLYLNFDVAAHNTAQEVVIVIVIDWIKAIYADGTEILIDDFGDSIVGIEKENPVPTGFKLEQNYPNPFNPSTKIQFSIPETSPVMLQIYDQLGRVIKTLIAKDELSAGSYTVIWNGDDQNGNKVASGRYMYTLSTNKFHLSKKMILVK